jgi:hypothetical protein
VNGASEVTRVSFESLQKGSTLPAFTVAPAAEDVTAYLEATGEPVERWLESSMVPPLMLVAWMIAGLMERIEIPDRLLHAGQEFEMRRALRQDEAVEIRFVVSSYALRQGAIMAAFGIEAYAGDELVATSRASVVVPPSEDSGGAK